MTTGNWQTSTIEDGFVQTGYVAEKPGLYCAVEYEFIPPLPIEAEEAITKVQDARTPKEVMLFMIDTIATRVKRWSLSSEVSHQVVARLRSRQQLLRIFQQIVGESRMDDNPADADKVSSGIQDSEMAAIEARLGKLPSTIG